MYVFNYEKTKSKQWKYTDLLRITPDA